MNMQFSYIWPIDRNLSGTTTPGQSGPGSDGNEEVLRILHSASIARVSLSDWLVSYPRQSAEKQSMYFTADWARKCQKCVTKVF